jgi:hypothetical protein
VLVGTDWDTVGTCWNSTGFDALRWLFPLPGPRQRAVREDLVTGGSWSPNRQSAIALKPSGSSASAAAFSQMLPVARRRTPLHARYLCPRGHADPNMSPCHAGGLEPSSTSCKTSRCVFHFVDYIFPSHTISFNTQQAVTNWQRRVHIHARRVYELHSPLHLHIEVARVRVTMEETQCNAPLVTCRLGAASGCAVKCQSSSTVDFGRLCELRRTFVGVPFPQAQAQAQAQSSTADGT